MTYVDGEQVLTCPIELAIAVIGDKWKILILRELFRATRRFNELKKRLAPISQKMLAQQLQALEADGIVLRTQYPEIPPKVEYSLTELGRSLAPVMATLGEWGLEYQSAFENRYNMAIDERSRISVAHLRQI